MCSNVISFNVIFSLTYPKNNRLVPIGKSLSHRTKSKVDAMEKRQLRFLPQNQGS